MINKSNNEEEEEEEEEDEEEEYIVKRISLKVNKTWNLIQQQHQH